MEFEFDDSEPYEVNFTRWFFMNTKEKLGHNEEPYSRSMAQQVFNEMFGHKKIKTNEHNLSERLKNVKHDIKKGGA